MDGGGRDNIAKDSEHKVMCRGCGLAPGERPAGVVVPLLCNSELQISVFVTTWVERQWGNVGENGEWLELSFKCPIVSGKVPDVCV